MDCTYVSITNDLNFLAHYGVPGQEWYVNKAARYQNHAQYAKGHPFSIIKKAKEGVKNVSNSVQRLKAKHDAKLDAAINRMDESSKAKMYFNMRRLGASSAAGVLSGLAAGLTAGRITLGSIRLINSEKIFLVNPIFKAKTNILTAPKQADAYKIYKQEYDKMSAIRNNYDLPFSEHKSAKDDFNKIKSAYNARHDQGTLQDRVTRRAIPIASVSGFAVEFSRYRAAATRNYNKRGNGTLSGYKVSDAYAASYKQTFDEYVNKFS